MRYSAMTEAILDRAARMAWEEAREEVLDRARELNEAAEATGRDGQVVKLAGWRGRRPA